MYPHNSNGHLREIWNAALGFRGEKEVFPVQGIPVSITDGCFIKTISTPGSSAEIADI